MGVQGGEAPLKIQLNFKNLFPLPRLRGNRYLSGMGAGGGRGVGTIELTRPGRRERGGWHRRPGKSLRKGRSGILGHSIPPGWENPPENPGE